MTKERLKNKGSLLLLAVIVFSAGLQSCVSVKAYQKMYLNDQDMQLSIRKIEIPELNFQSYREGASGGSKGKTGGGCGCN